MGEKIKRGDEIVELKEEDRKRVNRNLYKIKSLTKVFTNLEFKDKGGGSIDTWGINFAIEDTIHEVHAILSKYGFQGGDF
ncbi:MAG: hypothetical protein AMJ42_03050 [Deltaproteobacteria bacterium DG_8]|nr:MAG: hypothetical protein AMJ42_03050 [Deltaproteobacteria bacterium DG_8]